MNIDGNLVEFNSIKIFLAEFNIMEYEYDTFSNKYDEVFPLFIRYTNDDVTYHNKDATVSFEDITNEITGTQTCYFVHRKRNGKGKVFDELAIKFKDVPYCMTAQLARDECTLRTPHFTIKNMVLPEEEMYKSHEFKVHFVGLREDVFRLINSIGIHFSDYFEKLSYGDKLKTFLKECFSLQIPPIEIEIEEDKEMWQATLMDLMHY